MNLSLPRLPLALAAAATLLALTGAHARAATPSWCGPKKTQLALLDGFGGNSWREITRAAAAQEAAECPSVTSFDYANAQGNTAKAISDIKSMAARGVGALVVFGDSGPAILPALTSVYRAGDVVVPYRVDVGGKAGVNYTQFVGSSFDNDGKNWGEWIKTNFPNGAKMLFLSGPAGNSQGEEELAGLKTVLGSNYVFLNPPPYDVTNWDPALTQQVLTSEISKHPDIDVIISDFGPSLVGALPVFQKFHRSIPAIVTSDGNSLGCFWAQHHKDNPDFKLFTVATGNDNARLAVQWAVAEATGGKVPDTNMFRAPVFEDSVTGKPNPVECRADLPGNIYLSAQMAADAQAKVINQ
jgi:ribose transport system substrate-binding protein